MPAKPAKTYLATIKGDGKTVMSAIEIPFDPKEAFGRARAPVRVTLNGYSYRSTTFTMGGERFVPLRQSNREAAGVRIGQRIKVTLALDTAKRTIKAPADLTAALRAADVLKAFKALSFTHQREHIEAIVDAKKPETRARRVAQCVAKLRERADA